MNLTFGWMIRNNEMDCFRLDDVMIGMDWIDIMTVMEWIGLDCHYDCNGMDCIGLDDIMTVMEWNVLNWNWMTLLLYWNGSKTYLI